MLSLPVSRTLALIFRLFGNSLSIPYWLSSNFSFFFCFGFFEKSFSARIGDKRSDVALHCSVDHAVDGSESKRYVCDR